MHREKVRDTGRETGVMRVGKRDELRVTQVASGDGLDRAIEKWTMKHDKAGEHVHGPGCLAA